MRSSILACLLALVLGGCGSTPRDSAKEFDGDKAKVAAVVEELETAARKNEPGKVCTDLLSDRLLKTLSDQGTTCTTAVKDAFADADSFDLTVDDVTVSGTKATAKVVSGSGSDEKTDALTFERDGTAWKIVSLRV